MTTIRFDFEGDIEHDWYQVTSGGTGILPDVWFPYGDPARTVEYGTPNENDVHLAHLVKTGKQSLGYDKVWDTHDGGSGYFVTTTPGQMLEFLMFGRYIYHTPSDDAGPSVAPIHMRIGIDPTGAGEPGPQTIWSREQEIATLGWDAPITWYPFEVTARAVASIATLFLYTNPDKLGYRGNGPVWDDGYCNITDNGGECWGQPREQFKRTINVAPSVAVAHRILDIVAVEEETSPGAKDGFQMVGPSSDEAGLGMVEDKTAVEWNRPLAQQEGYRNFYGTHYPRAKVNFRNTEPGPSEITLYSQRDLLWRNHVYGGGQTLGAAGCLITCIAMLTGDVPPAVAAKLKDVGALEGAYLSRPALVTDAYPDLPYGGTVHWRNVPADLNVLADWLADGPIVVETEFSPGGAIPPSDQHFVIGLEIDGGDLIIADPWTGEITRLLERYALGNWTLARALYGARLFGHGPQAPPLKPRYSNLLGVQIQNPSTDAINYYAATQPSVYLTIQHFQTVVGVKAVSPRTNTVIRRFPNNFLGKGPVQALVAGIADDLRVLHASVDFVQLLNEQIPSANPDSIREANDTEIWGMEALARLGHDDVGVVIHCAGVGNPYGPWDAEQGKWDEQPLLVKAALAAEDMFPGRWAIGYHAYWPSNLNATYLTYANVNGKRSYVGRYYAFRWMEWDKEFRKHGLKPQYLFTEMGPIGTHGPRPESGYIDLLPNDGWKSSNCLGNNRARLMAECAQWQAECAAWNTSHENLVLGGAFFIVNPNSDWKKFAFEEPEMKAWEMHLEG